MNHIRDEGNYLLESNVSLTGFNDYINTYQFQYIYVTQKSLYDRLVSHRKNIIGETAKLALESSTVSVSRESVDNLFAVLSKIRKLRKWMYYQLNRKAGFRSIHFFDTTSS